MSPHAVFQNLKTIKKTRMLIALLIAVALVAIQVGSSKVIATTTAAAQTDVVLEPTDAPMLEGTFQPIGKTAGLQWQPSTAGNLVSYTDIENSQGRVRYFDLATNTDHLIPGESSSSSSVSGGRIAFHEIPSPGAFQSVVFDPVSQTRTVVLPGLALPAIGGNLIALVKPLGLPNDFEIETYDLNTGATTRLTNDIWMDSHQQVSPSGNAVVWRKCTRSAIGCDIYSAIQTSPGVFTTRQLTGPDTEDLQPDTNGEIAAYLKRPDIVGAEADVYFQPVEGGEETRLQIPLVQQSVRVAGNLIAFDSLIQVSQNTFQVDIFVYDISTGILSRVTNTPETELLGDFNISGGVGRMVYYKSDDIFAFTFPVPNSPEQQIDDLTDLIASLSLHPGTGSSLITKLQDALTAIEAGDTATACDSLTSFINQCRAQSGKKLTADQATQLIDSANEIKTSLGCQ